MLRLASLLTLATMAGGTLGQFSQPVQYTATPVGMIEATRLLEPGGLGRMERELAQTTDPKRRIALWTALAASGEPRFWPVLLALADEPDRSVHWMAMQVMHQHPGPAKVILTDLAAKGSPGAARLLRMYADVPEAFRDLRHHRDPRFRVIEVETMPYGFELAAMLDDPDSEVRQAAAKLIRRSDYEVRLEDLNPGENLEDIEAHRAYRRKLFKLIAEHRDWRIRALATEATAHGRIGPTFTKALAQDGDHRVRTEVFRWLRQLPHFSYTPERSAALPILFQAALHSRGEEQSTAMQSALALGVSRRDPRWTAQDRALLKAFMRERAVENLIRKRVPRNPVDPLTSYHGGYPGVVQLLVTSDMPDRFQLLDQCLANGLVGEVRYSLEHLAGKEAVRWWYVHVLKRYEAAKLTSGEEMHGEAGQFAFLLSGLGALPAFDDAGPILALLDATPPGPLRSNLIRGLGHLSKDPRTLVTLGRLAKSGSADAQPAIWGLGATVHRYTEAILNELLTHPDARIAQTAKSALRDLLAARQRG